MYHNFISGYSYFRFSNFFLHFFKICFGLVHIFWVRTFSLLSCILESSRSSLYTETEEERLRCHQRRPCLRWPNRRSYCDKTAITASRNPGLELPLMLTLRYFSHFPSFDFSFLIVDFFYKQDHVLRSLNTKIEKSKRYFFGWNILIDEFGGNFVGDRFMP